MGDSKRKRKREQVGEGVARGKGFEVALGVESTQPRHQGAGIGSVDFAPYKGEGTPPSLSLPFSVLEEMEATAEGAVKEELKGNREELLSLACGGGEEGVQEKVGVSLVDEGFRSRTSESFGRVLAEALEMGIVDPDEENRFRSLAFLDGVEDLADYQGLFLQLFSLCSNIGDVYRNRDGVLNSIVVGQTGVAKSSILEQAARALGYYPIVLRLQAQDIGSVAGRFMVVDTQEEFDSLARAFSLPSSMVREKVETFHALTGGRDIDIRMIPDYLFELFLASEKIKEKGGVGVALILDEFDKADAETLSALANLILKRRFKQLPLPDNLVIIGTANSRKGGAIDDFVGGAALQNRICVVDLDFYDPKADFSNLPAVRLEFLRKRHEFLKLKRSPLHALLVEKYGEEGFAQKQKILSTKIDYSSHRWKVCSQLARVLIARYLDEAGAKGVLVGNSVISLKTLFQRSFSEATGGGERMSPFHSLRALYATANVFATSLYYGFSPRVRNAAIGGLLETALAENLINFFLGALD